MSECGVCTGGNDGESMDMLSETTPVCRIPFKCCECRREVPKGERYEKHVGVQYGEFSKYRTCTVCAEIRNTFSCGEGWFYEQLGEEMRAFGFENLTTASPCFIKLSTKAKEFVLEQWRKWKGL